MFDIRKFGAFISKKRKELNMTQSYLADGLGLTRQAISNYECGNTFPDMDTLIKLAKLLNISLDELIYSANPTKLEANLLINQDTQFDQNSAVIPDEVVNISPFLQPNVLNKLAEKLSESGISITNIINLAEYMNDDSVGIMLNNATFDVLDINFLDKLLPFLNEESKYIIFDKILNKEIDYRLLKSFKNNNSQFVQLIENAVMCGVLDKEVLQIRED